MSMLVVQGLRVLGTIILLTVGLLAAHWGAAYTRTLCSRKGKIDPTVGSLLGKLVYALVAGVTLIAVLERFGVATTSLVALLGVAGLTIGLALQGTLSNVAAGVMLLVMRPFKVGQAVKIGGSVYLIDEIGLFVTNAHEPDGPKVSLPNGQVWGTILTNYSVTHNDQRRINETFAISYGDDIDKAIGVIKQLLEEEERILDDPPPLVEVSKLNDSSVDLLVWAWTQREHWWPTKLALTKRVKQAFDREGIVIPFPQQDVHLFQPPQA